MKVSELKIGFMEVFDFIPAEERRAIFNELYNNGGNTEHPITDEIDITVPVMDYIKLIFAADRGKAYAVADLECEIEKLKVEIERLKNEIS